MEGNSQVSQTQESSSKSEEKSTSQSNDLLESQIAILLDIKHNYQKGYTKIGNAGEIIFNEKDKADLYISRILETKKKLPLSDLTEEKDI